MQKKIDLVLVENETGVFFGLCDGSGPVERISDVLPPKVPHDKALEDFAQLLALSVTDATRLELARVADRETPESAPTPRT